MYAIQADHPLFQELRLGLFWHCTSPFEYRQIVKDEFIRPNDGRIQKWGNRPYACQELGGVSLFDFATESEHKVLNESIKWKQFLGCAKPLTVIIGIDGNRLFGKLTRFPDNLQNTTGNVIPWVEVCHCGAIPISTFTKFILVCSADYAHYSVHEGLTDEILSKKEKEFEKRVQAIGKKHEGKYTDAQIKMQKTIELARQLAKEIYQK